MYLQALHGHENIIKILNVLKADNDRDIYIVTDFMESDLHAVIKAKLLEEVHKQYIVYQVLKALKYMHSAELIHRDIKPSNILLNADCAVKLCDFGLARSVASTLTGSLTNPVMTDYVATRWYRAPEILFGSPSYTKGVDVWAIGCILGEMIIGKPVFPGTSTLDQLEKVIAVTGPPSRDDIESMESQYAQTMIDSISTTTNRRLLSDIFSSASPEALDFLKQCFQFNPRKRPSVAELLRHKYICKFRDPEHECDYSGGIIKIPLDDNIKLTISDYRTRIYDAIIQKKRENRLLVTKASENLFRPHPPIPVEQAPHPYSPQVVSYTSDNSERQVVGRVSRNSVAHPVSQEVERGPDRHSLSYPNRPEDPQRKHDRPRNVSRVYDGSRIGRSSTPQPSVMSSVYKSRSQSFMLLNRSSSSMATYGTSSADRPSNNMAGRYSLSGASVYNPVGSRTAAGEHNLLGGFFGNLFRRN
jgi:mitogen-activated protein kinase 15